MTKKIFDANALRPKFIRLYSGNGTYGAYIVFANQSEVPLYEGPSAAKAIHFAACAAANFEIKTKTDFQADSLLPGELELSYYWLRVFPTEETYLQALVMANLLLLPPDPV
jgi:hypothetical protein